MFLRRLGGWLPRPWGRRKPTKPDSEVPEPRWVDSSSENSGSDWDSAPETLGDGGPPKAKAPGTLRSSEATPEPSKELHAEHLGSKGMESLKWNTAVSSTQESERREVGGTLEIEPVDAGSNRRPGVSAEEGLSVAGPEAAVERPSRHQKLLGWLQGEPGSSPRYLGGPEECLQISTNLTLHLLELLASALLAVCSRPLRAALDALGLRGPLGLWLHGLLSFLAALHGLHAVLSLLTAHPLHFACLFGLLQALVLAVSLREPSGDEEATDLEGEGSERKDEEQRGDTGKRL